MVRRHDVVLRRSAGFGHFDQCGGPAARPRHQSLHRGQKLTYAFPPLSLTLFTLAPAPATVAAPVLQDGQLQLLLQGQPGTPYIIQTSPDLANWTSLSTNLLAGNSVTITNPISAGAPRQFYRAIWQP